MKPLSQLSCAGSEDSALFPDHVPIEPWDVDVTADVSSSPTTPGLHMHEVAASLILLAQELKKNNELMAHLIQTQKDLALAIREDGQEDDPDEPARYMDGSPVR